MEFNLKSVQNDIQNLLEKEKTNYNVNSLKTIFSLIDLTTLKPTDNASVIEGMCSKVNTLNETYPEMPQVAAICVYPSMVENVALNLNAKGVNIASVAAGFPASQTFVSVKVAETELAVEKGADEIDIVISLGKFLEGDYDFVGNEIRIIKDSMKNAHLKVILESGLMPNLNDVYKASVIAMNNGADFIKTSTGKENPPATLEAIYVMSMAIKEHYEKTGVKIGLKPAGGISTSEEVFKYYSVVKSVLGEEWLNNKLFRIGASRLANDLIKEIGKLEKREISNDYF
jgi:deoxyribose-phosphate aldolase